MQNLLILVLNERKIKGVEDELLTLQVGVSRIRLFFLTKNEHKDQHKTIFQHRYLHALVKSTTAEGIELISLSGRSKTYASLR